MNFDFSKQPCSDERLMLDELTHRINNEFAAAIGIVSVATALSTTDESRAALSRVLFRLESLARVHSALQIPDHDTRIDACAYLRQLCEAIVRSQLDYRGIQLILVEHPLPMNSVRCWKLGMILAELISNSVRHAFGAGTSGGVIRVEVQSRGPLVECRIQDNGSAAAKIQPGRGLGIVAALARRLDGNIDHQFGTTGSVSTVTFPLAPPTS
jgi:two-component sensor histidine kinase